jgi:hypothetical protein
MIFSTNYLQLLQALEGSLRAVFAMPVASMAAAKFEAY